MQIFSPFLPSPPIPEVLSFQAVVFEIVVREKLFSRKWQKNPDFMSSFLPEMRLP
jgi:hypothetical protein